VILSFKSFAFSKFSLSIQKVGNIDQTTFVFPRKNPEKIANFDSEFESSVLKIAAHTGKRVSGTNTFKTDKIVYVPLQKDN
jgi:hypothetical protein